MADYILTEAERQEINAEGERLNTWRAGRQPKAFLTFFREERYLQDLMAGKFYCNTPKYYRLNYERGVGDSQESVSYSGGLALGNKVDPDERIGPVTIGQMLKGSGAPAADQINDLEITMTTEGREHGWLHCWFSVDELQDAHQMASFLNDLHRVREEFGHSYVILNAHGYQKLMERFEHCGVAPIRIARVGYSDSRFHNGIGCKRLEYSYQREFRFVFSNIHSLG